MGWHKNREINLGRFGVCIKKAKITKHWRVGKDRALKQWGIIGAAVTFAMVINRTIRARTSIVADIR